MVLLKLLLVSALLLGIGDCNSVKLKKRPMPPPQDEADLFVNVPFMPGEGLIGEEIKSIERKGNGLMLHAAHRNASRVASAYITQAAISARRVRDILAIKRMRGTIGIMLWTNIEPWRFMVSDACVDEIPECKEFKELGGRKLFSAVRFYETVYMPHIMESRPLFQGWPPLWMYRIIGELHSPYAKTMVVDSDVYFCENFTTMFDDYLDDNHLFAATIALAMYGNTKGNKTALRPGMPESYIRFPERNLGVILMYTGKPKMIELLALFRDVYARHINDPSIYVVGDQASFREALFTMRPQIHDNIIPLNIGCRFEGGCADGCLTVHRHWNRDKSGDEVGTGENYRIPLTDAEGKDVGITPL